MPRRKIVCVIVEGPSDDEALGLLFSKIFDESQVFIYITYGDITTQKDTTPANILSKLGNVINSYLKSNHLKKVHFQEIIHIIDTDGAYIPDDAVDEDVSAVHPVYTLTKIYSANVEAIQQRNERKRNCLDKISSTNTICNIPYHVYILYVV